MRGYGVELIIDIYECNVDKFTRPHIEAYLIELCDNVINMERADLHWWDYEEEEEEYDKAPDHLKGTSCIQFITTSNITMHTLDVSGLAVINIFSCKEFNADAAVKFTVDYFEGDKWDHRTITRGVHV